MSLATRCSACGTMFRVVQDQLRVSEGWVRCGRCDTVFNAMEVLVDLDAEAAAAGADAAPSDDAFYGRTELDTEDGPHAAVDPPAFERPAPAPQALHDEPAWDAAATAESARDWPPALPEAPAAHDERVHAALLRPGQEPAFVAPALAGAGDTAPAPTPGFVRRAERDARWASPAMRAALLGSALILLAVLGMQAVYHFRDAVAARSAVADGLLRSACARWGCRVEAPRRIQDVSLEGSGLSRIAQQPQAVKLSINLRNRGSTDLVMPSVDLSLTDAQGQLIARRALTPADFRIDPPLIRRGAELPLELVLSTGERGVSGYTVELFYP